MADAAAQITPLFSTAEEALREVGDALIGVGMYPGHELGPHGAIRRELIDSFQGRCAGPVMDSYPMGGDVRSGRLVIRTARRNPGSLTGWSDSFWRGMPLHGGEALIQVVAPGVLAAQVDVPCRVLEWVLRLGCWRILETRKGE